MVFGVDAGLYAKLSALMFLEYAIWGAWYPVLSARLRGPLGFDRRQVLWIYATLPLACILTPLPAGQLADRWVSAELVLAGTGLLGALLLFVVAWKKSFRSVFTFMLLYGFCYAATLPLVNALMFGQLAASQIDVAKSAYIFMWAPVGWIASGHILRAYRRRRASEEQGRDCLVLAAVFSVITAVLCGSGVVRAAAGQTLAVASGGIGGLLGKPAVLVLLLISIPVAGAMQFCRLVRDPLRRERGIAVNWLPADQVAQIIVALLLLNGLVGWAGYGATLALGGVSSLVVLAMCLRTNGSSILLLTQSLHGLAWICFIIAGQMYVATVATGEISASAQALVFTAQSGAGALLATLLVARAAGKPSEDVQPDGSEPTA